MQNRTKIIILAAGKGVRMGGDLPKVLAKVKGKSMIKYVLDAVDKSGIDDKPIVVVGYKKELVINELGNKYQYVNQEPQLGTGHAVMSAEKELKDEPDNILVLYGDNPFVSPETIKKLEQKHSESKVKITMGTVKVPDFEDWRSFFYVSFSRIIRDKEENILKSVQFRDATEEEKKITEVDPCFFCFNAEWLWKKLKTLNNINAQKEYYLTDLVKVAMEEKIRIESINIEPQEALAANSKEELEILEKLAV